VILLEMSQNPIQCTLFSCKQLINSRHDDLHHSINIGSSSNDIDTHEEANGTAIVNHSESQTVAVVETVGKQSRHADAFVMVPEVLILDHNNIPSVSSTLVYRQPFILGAKLKYLIFHIGRSSVVSPNLHEPQHSVRLP
jgi:hypothetical protein